MVKSLRYWMKVLGLTNASGTELSDMGELVAKYDPYLEKPFTLWIMHSHIVKNVEDATTWYMYFNHCNIEEFDKSGKLHIFVIARGNINTRADNALCESA